VAFSVLALAVLAMLFLYAARKPMHGVIRSVCELLYQSTRFIARWLFLCADNLRVRNQSVLLAHGQESEAVVIDREFERVGNIIRKDMQEFPALQRKMMEEATRIEDDYHKCGEVPPPPPEWVGALKSVAQIKSGGDIPRKLLEDINKSIQKIHDQTVSEFRRSYEERHKILKAMQPSWRSVEKLTGEMEKKMLTLQTNAKQIDGHMEKLEAIRAKDNKTEHALTVSGFVQLAISTLVLVIALGGAFINYKLIALPMSEMVGAILAAIESSLALMRDMLVVDKASLMRDLASTAPPVSNGLLTSIPMIGQMIMGFVLPFALAFVAIPLEHAMHSLRTVIGVFLVQAMRGLGFALRFAGMLFKRFPKVLEPAYDILIVIPLMIERWVIGMRAGSTGNTGNTDNTEDKELSKLRRAA
jgi:hypothetical protein